MTGEHDAGKGDCPRKVDGEKFRSNYDAIFRKIEKDEKPKTPPAHRYDPITNTLEIPK